MAENKFTPDSVALPATDQAALLVLERHGIEVEPGGLIHVPAKATAWPAELWHAVDVLCDDWDYDYIIEGDR